MSSLSHSQKKSTFILITVLFLLAFVGFLDAFYLSATEFRGGIVSCGTGSCDEVTTSQYSKIFGISVAYLGFAHYGLMLILSFFVFALKKRSLLLFPILPLSIVGILASSWFVFAQVVLLKAICFYCMGSAATSTLIFVVSLLLVKKHKAHQSITPNGDSSALDSLETPPEEV